MAQYLKSEIQRRIEAGALAVFARSGYRQATMNQIARAAGISTGNIYRYHRTKAALFRAVVSEEFVRTFTDLLHRRVKALDGVRDVVALRADAPFHLVSEDLLRFCIRNRLRVVILVGRADGTPYHAFGTELGRSLQRLAVAHFRGLDPTLRQTPATRFALTRIYAAWTTTLVAILERFESEKDIRQAVGAYSRYHLTGLEALFARPPSSRSR